MESTRFEINIKAISVKGDEKAVYLLYHNKVIVKLEYRDITKIVKYVLAASEQEQLPEAEVIEIEDGTTDAE